MVNPDMPNIPGMGSMNDTLDFVKKLWGGMGIPGGQGAAAGMGMPGMQIPGMVVPTLSVDEINKKIADLKTVETWLAMNMNMLRGTIQALEVQAATLSALNAMGQTVSATMASMKAAGQAGAASRNEAAGEPDSGGAAKEAEPHAAAQAETKDGPDAAALAAPLVNAAAWWNMLQNQFQQAVGNAMSADAAEAARAGKAAPAEKDGDRTDGPGEAGTNGKPARPNAKPRSAAGSTRKSRPSRE